MNDISRAVQILRSGGLVAFPTETVYGLGADATNGEAVRRIFAAKGRPSTNPLIVHVIDESVARRYAAVWPDAAARLARRFWPGPLTLVLPKREVIVPEATAGRNTVGLRAPDHPLALQLLREFDGPVAAPSANRSTRVSPTTAQHVQEELGSAVDDILDGGACVVGIESTVLDLTGSQPTILRPGAVTAEQIAQEIGPVKTFKGVVHTSVAAASPGQHSIHYAPVTPAYRFDGEQAGRVLNWCRQHPHEPWAIVIIRSMIDEATAGELLAMADATHPVLEMSSGSTDYGRRLYATLRDLDAQHMAALWIQMPPDTPQWAAVRDRLTRATRQADLPE